MADQADVYVKNNFTGTIDAVRYLGSGASDLEITIPSGSEERILLSGTDTYIVIKAPTGVDTKFHWGKLKADLDMTMTFSRTDSTWKVQIVPNSLPPEVPTTVNIRLGDDEP